MAKYLRNHDSPSLNELMTPLHSTGRRRLTSDTCLAISKAATEVWAKRTPEQREEMKRKVSAGLAAAKARRQLLGL